MSHMHHPSPFHNITLSFILYLVLLHHHTYASKHLSIMSVTTQVDRHCIISSAVSDTSHRRRKRVRRSVRFCSEEYPVTKVEEVTHEYPPDYFYTRSETDRWVIYRVKLPSIASYAYTMHNFSPRYLRTQCVCFYSRFRREAREERMGSADSPVQRAFNIASSSVILVIFLIVGLISATIACLPILLLLKIASILYSFGSSPHEDDVDSSVHPYSPSSDIDGNSFIERSLLSLMGSLSWGTTEYNVHIQLSLGNRKNELLPCRYK